MSCNVPPRCTPKKELVVRDCKGHFAACEDYYKSCAKWAEEDECNKNAEWMAMNCRKSCKSCDRFKEAEIRKNCKF